MPITDRPPRFVGAWSSWGLRYGVAIRWFLTMWPAGARRPPTAGEIAARISGYRLAARDLGHRDHRSADRPLRRRAGPPGEESRRPPAAVRTGAHHRRAEVLPAQSQGHRDAARLGRHRPQPLAH